MNKVIVNGQEIAYENELKIEIFSEGSDASVNVNSGLNISGSNIVVSGNNNIVVTGNGSFSNFSSNVSINVDSAENVEAGGSVKVKGDVGGNVKASGSVHCNDINGNINAGGSVKGRSIVSDSINAGGSVKV